MEAAEIWYCCRSLVSHLEIHLCQQDKAGKLMEKLISYKLVNYAEVENGLSRMQFGFRFSVATIRVVVEAALKQKRRGNRCSAIVILYKVSNQKALPTDTHRAKTITAKARVMSNRSAIISGTGTLIFRVLTSKLRYSARVWAAGELSKRNLSPRNSTYLQVDGYESSQCVTGIYPRKRSASLLV